MSPHSSHSVCCLRFVFALTTLALVASSPAAADTPVACIVPDNGSGTANLPPLGCGYVSLSPMQIIDGLAPGSTVNCDARIDSFFDIFYLVGGPLGGGVEQFHAPLHLDMSGTGSLAGYFRPAFFDVFYEVREAPRGCCGDVQTFDTDMFYMQGQLPPGDPDFDLLRITGGSGFGMPSPGHTTLRSTATGWAVDSFFDITYRIDFVGAPGGVFAGRSGSTTGTIRMQCGTLTPVATENGAWGAVKSLYR
ncbi:MAG: hypothetical protein IPJ24_05895 [bacterium]|nr:hypothetical protein [bacterium]